MATTGEAEGCRLGEIPWSVWIFERDNGSPRIPAPTWRPLKEADSIPTEILGLAGVMALLWSSMRKQATLMSTGRRQLPAHLPISMRPCRTKMAKCGRAYYTDDKW